MHATHEAGPGGVTRTWSYHPTSKLLLTETHPESGTVQYTHYTADGLLQRKVDANGTEFVYAHDGNRRVTQITATPAGGPAQVTTLTYEPGSDRRATATVDGVTTALTYDPVGRLTPDRSPSPAAWYGIRRALAEIAAEVASIQGDRAADAQQTGPRVADAARNVLAWCEALAEVAQRVRGTRDLAAARALLPALRRLAQQILQGRDVDGNGRVTFAPGEAGLQLLQVSVRMRAATGGLLPDLPAPGGEVRQ